MKIMLTCTYISDDGQYADIGLSEDDTFEATLNEQTAKAIKKADAILNHNPMFCAIEIPAPYLCDIVEDWGNFRPICEVIRHCNGSTFFSVMDRKDANSEVEFEISFSDGELR